MQLAEGTARSWHAQATDVLRTLLRFETINPPGNETPAVEYLAGILRAEGLEPVVLESAPGRGNVVVRIRGNGQAAPLLLYGHVDVVPAEAQGWVRPPFSGDVDEGCIWGRGALDMKGAVAQQLMVVVLLQRYGVDLRRDVIFAATADEEAGGRAGMGFLVERYPELVRAEYALSEGGGTTMYIGGRSVYDIRTAEKGTCRFRLQAKGLPGHGSVPRRETAVTAIARAVTAMAASSLPFHATATAGHFFAALCTLLGASERTLTEASLRRLQQMLPSDLAQYLQAITRNTAVPTGLQAGHKINVIPGEAAALVDGRYLPGQSADQFLAEVTDVIGRGYTIEPLDLSTPLEEPPGDPLYRTIERVLERHAPRATVVPMMLAGATDAKHVTRLGTRCLGFSPIKVAPGFPIEHQVHGHNERIPLDGYLWGIQVLYDVVTRFCSA